MNIHRPQARRTILVTVVISVLALALDRPARASTPCVIGVYADPGGTESVVCDLHGLGVPLDIYVVLRADAEVRGVSFALTTPVFTAPIAAGSGSYGPEGDGSSVPSPGGENVSFANCVPGFDEQTILVARYETFIFDFSATGGLWEVVANSDSGSLPVYTTCDGQQVECPNTQALEIIYCDIPTEASSFSAIKALY